MCYRVKLKGLRCGALVATGAVQALGNEGQPLWLVKIRAVQFTSGHCKRGTYRGSWHCWN